MTGPRAEHLAGNVFKGLPLASRASWEQSGLPGEEAGPTVPYSRVAGCPGLGKTAPTQGGLLSQMGLGVPTEQDVGLHWKGDSPSLGLGVWGGTRGAARETCFPQAQSINELWGWPCDGRPAAHLKWCPDQSPGPQFGGWLSGPF